MHGRLACGLLAVLLLTGCRQPLRVTTDNQVRVYGPAPLERGPLHIMPVAGTTTDTSRRIALVDVDGLLLNQDMTGLQSDGENPVALFREKLDAIACDPRFAAVVLRINSPGGSVTASDVLWHDLNASVAHRLPVLSPMMWDRWALSSRPPITSYASDNRNRRHWRDPESLQSEDAMAQFNAVEFLSGGHHIDGARPSARRTIPNANYCSRWPTITLAFGERREAVPVV